MDDGVSVLVSDNGVGPSADFRRGYGLNSMSEKAEEFGGGIRISGDADEGCEVEIFIKSGD